LRSIRIRKLEKENSRLKEELTSTKLVLWIVFLSLLLTVIFTNVRYKSRIDELETNISFLELQLDHCDFSLCKERGTLEYCFVIKTNCIVLEDKCTHEEYLSQWNLNCTWGENECKCTLKT
jgi:hypothetical protein